MLFIHLMRLYLALVVGLFLVWAESPTEEMQMFIDECNIMIDTMESCEKNWVGLEHEIIDSVDGYADRILYTETLILDESAEILLMADKIVATEQLMSDLMKSCGCEKAVFTPRSLLDRLRSISKVVRSNVSAVTSSVAPTPYSFDAVVGFDHCSAMDQVIKVMDASIAMLATFNDDFVELLTYLLSGIDAMGDQIVYTECLIIDMSGQIGVMADRIVETEQLLADMTDSCCQALPLSTHPVRNKTARGAKRTMRAGDKDICSADPSSRRELAGTQRSGLFVKDTRKLLLAVRESLASASQQVGAAAPVEARLTAGQTFSRRAAATDINNNTRLGSDDGPMPCETWWDPFCCAAEVCADMMVEMMGVMSSGSDEMLEMCEDCVDEIAELSDDILVMEQQVLDMGLIIGDMADGIVHMIEIGSDCMGDFCKVVAPNLNAAGSGSGTGADGSSRILSVATAAELLGNMTSAVTAKRARLEQLVHARNDGSRMRAAAALGKLDEMHKTLAFIAKFVPSRTAAGTGGSLGGPMDAFGEFAEMVDVCMKMCKLMADMFTDQIGVMAHIGDEILNLSKDIITTSGYIVDMSANIVAMEGKMVETEEIMTDLVECIGSN